MTPLQSNDIMIRTSAYNLLLNWQGIKFAEMLLFQEYKSKLEQVTVVRKELKSHLANLPDLSKLPDVHGGLAPLPSAGDLFASGAQRT